MKSIKSTFVRTLSLLLALIMVFSIPISAFATTGEAEDYEVSTAAYTYDSTRATMIAHSAYQALKYLGYDVGLLKSEEVLYKYITSGLVDKGIRCQAIIICFFISTPAFRCIKTENGNKSMGSVVCNQSGGRNIQSSRFDDIPFAKGSDDIRLVAITYQSAKLDKKRTKISLRSFWRYRPDLNWGMRVLQTLALPLGHGTI